MFRLATLLCFAAIASGQVYSQPAYVWIETTASGELHATLSAPVAGDHASISAAFARSIGCGAPGLRKFTYEPGISVRCPGGRPSALTFHADIRLAELTAALREAGVEKLDLALTTPHFRCLNLDPPIAPRGRRSKGYYHARYSLDQAPRQITIDGGFELSQAWMLIACAMGLILAPFLLILPRPSDALGLRVRTEGVFVLGCICWVWVLLRVEAGALLGYLFGRWTMGPLLALLAPPLVAVWIGSRLAAVEYARLTPNGLGAAYYRHVRFWTGVAATCILSTLLGPLLSTSTNPFGSVLFGLVLAIACLARLMRTARGGSHPLSDGDLRKRMFELAAKARVNLRRVSILTSSSPRPPAAFATRWGAVLLNEGLLSQLSRREVDAIVCHELSHIRPVNRSVLVVAYLLAVAGTLGAMWVPNFVDLVPLLLLAAYFLFKGWRRSGERKADLDSVRWSDDPEAMITGLARVSLAHGMPLEWGAPVSWMLPHPATMDRIRAIARAGKVSELRIAELLEESRREPADHYVEAPVASIPEDAAFSPAMRQRLQTQLTLFTLLAPVPFGVSAVWLFERIGLDWWAVFLGASLSSMFALYVGFEWIMGALRATVKQRAVARHGPGVMTGFSPAAEPRLFDGMYHYDLGLVRFVDGALEFAGDRTRFRLHPRMARRVWLGDGPRHWTTRKVVYIECQPSPDAAPVIFSLQSFEAWIWPSTVTMAKRLYRQVEEWRQGAPPSAPPQPCTLPNVVGMPATLLPFRTVVRSIGIYSGAGFFLASVTATFEGPAAFLNPSSVFCPMAVCAVLSLFLAWPRLGWSRFKNLTASQVRLPADS